MMNRHVWLLSQVTLVMTIMAAATFMRYGPGIAPSFMLLTALIAMWQAQRYWTDE